MEFFPVILIAALVLVICLLLRPHRGPKTFDERQERLRGRAFRRGFFAMVIFASVYLTLCARFNWTLMADGMSLFTAAILGIGVFAVDAVWNDAYFPLNEKPSWYIGICGLTLAANLAGGLPALLNGTLLRGGVVSYDAMPLLCALMFLALFVTMLLKLWKDRSEEEE